MNDQPPLTLKQPEPPPAPPAPAMGDTGLLHHLVAFILLLCAAYFTLWFFITNEPLWLTRGAEGPRIGGVFRSLALPFTQSGGTMDWRMLGWSAGAVGIFSLFGWFFLESIELYIPRGAAAALAFITGMGLCGFVFELIAMAGLLNRAGVFVSLGFLLVILWPFAIWAAHRKPEAWGGGEGGGVEQTMRRELANEQYSRCLVWPRGLFQWLFCAVVFLMIAAITLLIFWHALLYPETYWDSLILYLGYARMMYFEHGIVRKVVGQVGIGLGANYPHLYSLLGAAATLAAREWSELPQRLIAPMAGLASTVLVYHTALRLTRHVNFALCVTLLYRAIPLGIIYDQYASDYALSILFAAAFLYVALLYIETGLSGYFILATALIGFAMHLNYLMGILWLPWGGMLLAAHARTPSPADEAEAELIEEQLRASLPPAALLLWEPPRETEPAWTRRMFRKPLKEFLSSPLFITTVMASAFVGSTWYIRNWIVTGNPVYAFFNDFFHGRHVNPEVMESAAKEWAANGSGIGRLGDDLTTRLRNTWAFFVDWKNSYQLEPFFAGFACFGALLLIARALASPFTAVKRADALGAAPALKFTDHGARFGFLALLLALALFAFHYLLAPYYLYQIAMVMPALAALGIFIFPYMRLRPWRWLFAVMVLLIGLVPGISMALMGFKLLRPVPVGNGRAETQVDLFALRHPLPDSALYYRWQWGADAEMWEYINANLKGEKILTHENRHLMFDPTIELIHLDDWAMQLIWPLSPGNQIKDLKSLGIRYYLFVPNERNHPVNAKMRTEEWVKLGLAVPVFQAGENRLFRLP